MTPFDCPRCGVTLTMTDRHGIEIDYCPQCRGVWLDRGELDKIVERASAAGPAPGAQAPAGGWTQPAPSYAPQPGYPPPQPQQGWYDDRRHHGGKRKNWLSELFD